jgi:hypothetical protein
LSPKQKQQFDLSIVFKTDQPNRVLGILRESSTTRQMGTLSGYRKTWESINQASSYTGYYTALLKTPMPLIGDQDVPQGSGGATFSVTGPTGGVNVVVKNSLGLGSTVSSFVSSQGEVFVYVPSLAAQSVMSGWCWITPSIGDNFARNALSGQWSWKKAAVPTSRLYRQGFAAHTLFVIGGKYSAPAAGEIIMGLAIAPPDNARLDFTEGGLVIGDIMPLRFSITNPSAASQKAIIPLAGSLLNPNKVSFALLASKGTFSGTFTTEPTNLQPIRKVAYQGFIARSTESFLGQGYFLLPQWPQAGQNLNTSSILSGHVSLTPAP